MCWKCGTPLTLSGPISRDETCPHCGADVRSCKNCRFYSPGSHYDCHENVDEPVSDKERANFCGYFSLNTASGATATGSASAQNAAARAESAKAAFNALFGD